MESRTIVVGGDRVTRDRFIGELRSGEPGATRRLRRQFATDRAQSGSVGLSLVDAAFGTQMRGFLARLLAEHKDALDDVWNATLIDIWDHVEAYELSKSTFKTWVYNRGKYQALTERRRRGRHPDLPTDSAIVESAEDPTAAPPDPLTREEARTLRQAFLRLSETERHVLWLRYVEGWLPSEIVRRGFIEGVSEDSLRVYLHRATRRLERLVEERRAAPSEPYVLATEES